MFNERKATELASHLLSWAGGQMKYIKLLKLIYLVDRFALDKEGHGISTDRWVSMKNGPVPNQTYNLITEQDDPEHHPVWNEYIKDLADYCVGLSGDPMGLHHMSESELEIARQVWDQYGHRPTWGPDGLVDLTHTFPEWEDPTENPDGPQSLPIHLERVLSALGKSEEEIQAILELEQTDDWLDDILAT